MLPALLITFREVVEAVLIVATIAGLVIRMGEKQRIPTIIWATVTAVAASILVVVGGSFIGIRVSELYEGPSEALIEGILMLVSGAFILWAVLSLHAHFAHHKVHLLQRIRTSVETQENRILAILVFTSVFREGIEIALFLSTTFLQTDPQQVLLGFGLGAMFGLFIAVLLLTFTIRLPVYWAFRISTFLLILFSAGLFVRGIHEFVELGYLPETPEFGIAVLAQANTFTQQMVKALFGITHTMSALQATLYVGYTATLLYLTRTAKQSN